MEGFSVINLQQFHYYQESFGYINVSSKTFEETIEILVMMI